MPKVVLEFETMEQAEAYMEYWENTGEQDYPNCVHDMGGPVCDNLLVYIDNEE